MSEICETCAAPIEGGTPFSRYCDTHLETPDNKPAHLSAEYWAKCTDIRAYLMTVLDELILGVGIREPDTETDPELMLFLAPTEAAGGIVSYEWQTGRFIVSDRVYYSNLADYYAVIPTEGRPALQVSELLRGAVKLLDIIE